MFKKVKILIAFISLSVCLCLMSNTYSRYVAAATGDVEALFAKWQILVNNTDITTNQASVINIIPVIEENEYVASNVVAPASKGYFDIIIDPTNVEVSFNYTVALGIQNENLPDVMIKGYSIIPQNYLEGDPLDVIDIEESAITNTLDFDNTNELFKFEAFTIRVYFEWHEGENEVMTNEDDTAVGMAAVNENTTFSMNANISFEQKF